MTLRPKIKTNHTRSMRHFAPKERRSAAERKHLRYLKREAKARQYRAAALAGGGKREVERRRRQFGAVTIEVALADAA